MHRRRKPPNTMPQCRSIPYIIRQLMQLHQLKSFSGADTLKLPGPLRGGGWACTHSKQTLTHTHLIVFACTHACKHKTHFLQNRPVTLHFEILCMFESKKNKRFFLQGDQGNVPRLPSKVDGVSPGCLQRRRVCGKGWWFAAGVLICVFAELEAGRFAICKAKHGQIISVDGPSRQVFEIRRRTKESRRGHTDRATNHVCQNAQNFDTPSWHPRTVLQLKSARFSG